MGLSTECSCEAGSFSLHHNHYRFLQPEISRLSFPISEPWVWRSVSLPSCSSQFIHMQMWDCLVFQPPPQLSVTLAAALLLVLSSPVACLRPSCLNACFFFHSLVVQTSVQFSFLALLVIFCFCICCPFGCMRR